MFLTPQQLPAKIDQPALTRLLASAGYCLNSRINDPKADDIWEVTMLDGPDVADVPAMLAVVDSHDGEPLPIDPIIANGKLVEMREHDGKLYAMRESGPEEISASALSPRVIE